MKHFIYTYSEKQERHATLKTVRIYRIKRGMPTLETTLSETFVSEFQLVMMAMEAARLLPRKAFARTQSHGYLYAYGFMLEEAKIATVRRVL